jgi:hypothetical protein
VSQQQRKENDHVSEVPPPEWAPIAAVAGGGSEAGSTYGRIFHLAESGEEAGGGNAD